MLEKNIYLTYTTCLIFLMYGEILNNNSDQIKILHRENVKCYSLLSRNLTYDKKANMFSDVCGT